MSLLDTASLIVTPNGYKEGKLYSVIPSDGSGDMSVTRATTATRVNSQGLVELVPYNLLTYSEQLNDSSWNKLNVTITPNTTIAPDGTLSADTMTNSSTGYGLWQQVSVAPSTQYTFSFYVKKGTNTSYIISVIDAVSFADIATLDYSSQVGTDWVRVSTTFTTLSTTSFIRVYQMRDGSSTGTAFLWGAQLVEGSVAKDYQKTETRLNIPRLDYSNGTCPSILVEPQRTNVLTWSSSFDNAAWTLDNISISANNTNSPSGINDADKFIENTSFATHRAGQTVSGTGTYTFSCYVKAGEREKVAIFSPPTDVGFDLSNGTIINIGYGTSGASIESVGNGWWRIALTFNATSLATSYVGLLNNSNQVGYTGDGTSGAYFWGAQLELGSYPTSYIPTTSASVTRNADVISKTGISSLIGQTEGVFYSEFTCDFKNPNGSIPIYLRGSGGGGSYSYSTYVQMGANNFNVLVFSNNVAQLSLNSGTLTDGQMVKMAFAYKANDFVLYINGVQTSFYNAGTPSIGLNALDFGSYFAAPGVFDYDGYIKSFALWKTRLTNTQLAQLTTL